MEDLVETNRQLKLTFNVPFLISFSFFSNSLLNAKASKSELSLDSLLVCLDVDLLLCFISCWIT